MTHEYIKELGDLRTLAVSAMERHRAAVHEVNEAGVRMEVAYAESFSSNRDVGELEDDCDHVHPDTGPGELGTKCGICGRPIEPPEVGFSQEQLSVGLAVQDEREACAKIADEMAAKLQKRGAGIGYFSVATELALAIRQRS